MAAKDNPSCPNPDAHWENAHELLGFSWRQVLTPEQQASVDAEAELEYRNCEGHC